MNVNHRIGQCMFSASLVKIPTDGISGRKTLERQSHDNSYIMYYTQDHGRRGKNTAISSAIIDRSDADQSIKSMLIMVSWEIWQERNNCTFTGMIAAVNDIVVPGGCKMH